MNPNLLGNPLAAGPEFPLSLWQKRQAALLYYWMSLDYLKGLKEMIDKLIAGADVLLDVAKSQGRDALLTNERWGVRDTSANWSTYGYPALADFRKSTIWHIAARTNEIYGATGTNQCAHMMSEISSRWMTPDEEDAFGEQCGAVFSYGYRIDDAVGAGGQRTLKDSSMVGFWQEYAGRFPRLPKFRVRTDVVGKTDKRPPRTGVYVPQDDPYGTLQFAWTGDSEGALGEVQTFNDAGLAAVKAIGRDALWLDEPKMMAYVIEALKQKRLQPKRGIDWKDVDDLIAARLVLRPQVFTERSCKWYFVEMIDGEFDDATEDEVNMTESVGRPNVPAGQPCPESGWWFTPAKTGSRRYFKAKEIMPDFNSKYGSTIWQWDIDQSNPKL
ncbi:MAG: hypothetical protein LBE62_11905 [Azonexus sp.]|jgi:hypothetical protein|nr:hypothetical protein [Azonexus sp.]